MIFVYLLTNIFIVFTNMYEKTLNNQIEFIIFICLIKLQKSVHAYRI